MPMTPEAKSSLARVIRGSKTDQGDRGLRGRLLDDLHAKTEGAYRLSLKAKDAMLDEATRIQRERFESWVFEQVRSLPKKEQAGASDRFRLEVEKDAASTLLNRIVFLRLLEASGLRDENVVTGGWESQGYKQFREFAPELVRGDESEGYAKLLQLVFDDLAIDLPGLYGNVRLTALIPVPAATLRAVVEALDAPALESCWTDDMTLGWIYQYWNDPEREALDEMVKNRHSIQRHELASKTQMFTDRYMVDWVLQNSLGPMWLAMCKKHSWKPEVEADGTLARLEERRIGWRAKREAGEVSLTELMPLESDAERRWAYYVPQRIPDDAVKHANESVRDLKILDPAVGSGHFLVVAFDLLAALYREEARHRGEEGEPRWSERAIVERILEHNLHGVDLDPRAVQIAAAALFLKAQQTCAEAHPRQLNLVASNLRLSSLPADDPARKELRAEVERATGVPAELTQRLLDALAGADHLGSLLKIDVAVDEALAECEELLGRPEQAQGDFFNEDWKNRRTPIDVEEAKATMLSRLESFLHAHSHGDDLGLKLRGEQLASGVRFVRILREGVYDLVVANPPYHAASKMAADAATFQSVYSMGRADLFAAFILRSMELLRVGGRSSTVTLSNWMFLKAFSDFRDQMMTRHQLYLLCDMGKGPFSSGSKLISASMNLFAKLPAEQSQAVAIRPYENGDTSTDDGRIDRNTASLLAGTGRHDFDPTALKVVPEWPLVYWWGEDFLQRYAETPKLGDESDVKQGMATADNKRFLRQPWEVNSREVLLCRTDEEGEILPLARWAPYIKGAAGQAWFEPLNDVIDWRSNGLSNKLVRGATAGKNDPFYFIPGICYSTIGNRFAARLRRYRSVFDVSGSSVFPKHPAGVCCLMNSVTAREILSALNPTVNFQVSDIKRLPLFEIESAEEILAQIETEFAVHEGHRELSVEYRAPGPSPWRHAQDWAQLAVDRPEGKPLPPYVEELDPEPATDHLSFAFGVALGRFGAEGEGVLDPSKDDLSSALPSGICFLDGSLEKSAAGDSLCHSAAELLHAKWAEHGPAVDPATDLRTWLRLKFFGDVHKGMYENRPIYFPLSSEKKNFVAFVSIHRWAEGTLRALLAEHIHPALTRLEGEIADLRESRQSEDKKIAGEAERRYDQVVKWKQELDDFIEKVEQCAEKGPSPSDTKTPERGIDARYAPELDDGVMINSAALWPLLGPQWKDPKKWWRELATAKGKRDYDWAHLAARYFPSRVDKKCQADPSLGVAHGCFWKYHPETAYKWELRLQDEIAPDFTIDEEGSDAFRAAFEREYPEKVKELIEAERRRREKNTKKKEEEAASPGPLFDAGDEPTARGAARL